MRALYLRAAAMARALRERRFSAMQALEASIERIEARDGELNAVAVRDFGRAHAAADEALAVSGGLPIGVQIIGP